LWKYEYQIVHGILGPSFVRRSRSTSSSQNVYEYPFLVQIQEGIDSC
jgi:hypothetical protein